MNPYCKACDRVTLPVVRGEPGYCPLYPLTDAARTRPTPLVRGQRPRFVLGEPDTTDKRLDCRWYGECLDHAASLDWDGWSCADCTVYEAEEPAVVIIREPQEPASIDHVLGEHERGP